jgi:hypothetical protein
LFRVSEYRSSAIPFKRQLAYLGGAMQLFPTGQQRCISAGCGRIDRHRLFGGKAHKVMRSARLGAGA